MQLTTYLTTEIDPNRPQLHPLTVKYASRSSPGHFHRVSRLPDGRWTCDCTGFAYRQDCWHVEDARRTYDLEGVQIPGGLL